MRCIIHDCGLIEYGKAYDRQKAAVEEVLAGRPARLLLCEHPAVLTLGRLADEGHILVPREELARRGVAVHAIDRGGEVTLHAPGQLVVYAILDLKKFKKDLKYYTYMLEAAALRFLEACGVKAERSPGRTGVWAGERKIVSLGIGVRRWVTFHGLGLNISTDLTLFDVIRPCGLPVRMTSLSEILGRDVTVSEAKVVFVRAFCEIFGLEPSYD